MCERRLAVPATIAEELKPGSCSITLFADVLRLNVGRIAILALMRESIGFTLVDAVLGDDDRRVVSDFGEVQPFTAATVPGLVALELSADALPVVEQHIGAAHRRAIEMAIERAPRT